MSDRPTPTAEELLQTYFRAKDENRPHLMREVFAPDATLEMVVNTGTISFPPVSRGLSAITDVLVRNFGQTYENVYSFYLDRPRRCVASFSCDWLVGMSEKAAGNVRIGCGRYDWHFQTRAPGKVERLAITVAVMAVLPPASSDRVFDWLAHLPRPWCDAALVGGTVPVELHLDDVLRYLGRGKTRL